MPPMELMSWPNPCVRVWVAWNGTGRIDEGNVTATTTTTAAQWIDLQRVYREAEDGGGDHRPDFVEELV
jgi:hypothetical protein